MRSQSNLLFCKTLGLLQKSKLIITQLFSCRLARNPYKFLNYNGQVTLSSERSRGNVKQRSPRIVQESWEIGCTAKKYTRYEFLARIIIHEVWKGQNGWWWDGCAECRWRIGNTVWICTVFWVYRVLMRWWGGVDWGGLGMWNVRVRMIECRPVEMWWWQGWDWLIDEIYSFDMNPQRCAGRRRKTWYECVKDVWRHLDHFEKSLSQRYFRNISGISWQYFGDFFVKNLRENQCNLSQA